MKRTFDVLNERDRACGDVCRMWILHFARGASDTTRQPSFVDFVRHTQENGTARVKKKKITRNYYFERQEQKRVAVVAVQFSIRRLLISCIVRHRTSSSSCSIIPFRRTRSDVHPVRSAGHFAYANGRTKPIRIVRERPEDNAIIPSNYAPLRKTRKWWLYQTAPYTRCKVKAKRAGGYSFRLGSTSSHANDLFHLQNSDCPSSRNIHFKRKLFNVQASIYALRSIARLAAASQPLLARPLSLARAYKMPKTTFFLCNTNDVRLYIRFVTHIVTHSTSQVSIGTTFKINIIFSIFEYVPLWKEMREDISHAKYSRKSARVPVCARVCVCELRMFNLCLADLWLME